MLFLIAEKITYRAALQMSTSKSITSITMASILYTFSPKLLTLRYQVKPMIDHDRNINELIKGNFNEFTFPITYVKDKPDILADVLDTGNLSLYLISDKIFNVLVNSKATGWLEYPINFIDKDGKTIPGYHGLSISGKSSERDFSYSGIITKQIGKNGPKLDYYVGHKIHDDIESLPDIFIPNNTLEILVKEKVAMAIKAIKPTNCSLSEVSKQHYSTRVFL